MFPDKHTPRWIIFLADLGVVLFSVLFAYMLRFNFDIPPRDLNPLPKVVAYILAVRAVSFLLARSYAGIIRYTGTRDAVRVLVAVLSGSILFSLTNLVTYYLIGRFFFIPFSVIIIDFLLTTMILVSMRILVKIAYMEFAGPERQRVNVIIYGADEAGITAKRVLERDLSRRYRVLAFVDDTSENAGKKIEGTDIITPQRFENILVTRPPEQVVLALPGITRQKKEELVDLCLIHEVSVLTVPPMIEWVNGELSFKQIRTINIEELLERPEIRLDEEKVRGQIAARTILVTGAAGSIGSEIARQLTRFFPEKLILIDQAETPLHNLKLEFNEHFPETRAEFVMADICNPARMKALFNRFRPEILYHAAAYKHVPMMEENVPEAVTTNITGTRILADLSRAHRLDRFIMISTDKAVNPTSVMGASKRVAEIYVQSLNGGNTKFITTRFGNVLGSSGSVIPLFRNQIEKGGPLTVTHPEITRFFMTIPEACRLVLEAGVMGQGGEIFIFDMGKPIRIVDLAKKMIKLSGLTEGRDIEIRYTGLRPGEKLYEELLNKEENTLPTHHPLIMIAKVKEYDRETIEGMIGQLEKMATNKPASDLVAKMRSIVPEFTSQNSEFAR